MKKISSIRFDRRPSQVAILIFTRHLATMIKSGISLVESLHILAEHQKNVKFKSVIGNIAEKVSAGQNLSAAMAEYPKFFSPFFIHLLSISEESGSLEENLSFIAKELKKNVLLRKKIKAALLYPAIILFTAIIMGGFIALFILPQLVDFFDTLQVDLPLSTRVLLFFATAFKHFGIEIVIAVIAAAVGLKVTLNAKPLVPFWHKLKLRLPMIGPFLKLSQIAQFSRNFGILLQSGVPAVKALQITSSTLSNLTYQAAVQDLSHQLSEGEDISTVIEKNYHHIIPPLVSRMVAVGERTGSLDSALLYVGEFYEEEIDTFSKNLTTVLEPILLLGIGILVGLVALSIITPIYELSGSIRN